MSLKCATIEVPVGQKCDATNVCVSGELCGHLAGVIEIQLIPLTRIRKVWYARTPCARHPALLQRWTKIALPQHVIKVTDLDRSRISLKNY